MEQFCPNFNEERQQQQEIIAGILTELSNHDDRTMERRKAMSTLKFMTRDGTFILWEEHFKEILLILLETLGDNDPDVRSYALRVLGEICLSQSARFREFAELTIHRVVKAHKDDDREVVRAAEECAAILASRLPPLVCLRILNPIVKNKDTQFSLAAVKMVRKAIKKMSPTEVESVLVDIVPLIIKTYTHPTHSIIRLASVVCLVALHQIIGMEKLEPYLASLNSSKMRLFNLYVRSAQRNSLERVPQLST